MLVSDAISEIVRLVNNPNKANDALLWLKHTLREIWGYGRWQFNLTDRVRQLAPSNGVTPLYFPLPSDFEELVEPILFRTDITVTSTITISNTTLDPATVGTPYTFQFVLSGGSDGWSRPTEPWRSDYILPLRRQDMDYSVKDFGIEFSPKFNSGGAMWMQYYRVPAIPQHTTDTIPLPEQFVYRLAVYGAARHGLIREDDYDRLQYAENQFAKALDEMRIWDNRRKIANSVDRASSQLQNRFVDYGPGVFPPNFAV